MEQNALVRILLTQLEKSVSDPPFDFSKNIDMLSSHYKMACRDKFPEWKGAETTSYKITACGLGTNALSEENMKYSKEEQGRSYLKSVLQVAFQLGYEQALRVKKEEQQFINKVFNTNEPT